MLTILVDAIEGEQDINVNTASDFIAQYTTRQEYRFYGAGAVDPDEEWLRPNGLSKHPAFFPDLL